MRIICCWDISICAVSPITAQMWIKPVILTKKCHNCILKMHHTIFYQINWICKQKSSMSKKYSHLRSSCTNTNIFWENITLNIVCIIQTGYVNFHFYSLMNLYKDATQVRNLYLCSLTKYCPNAKKQLQKGLLLRNQARLSSNHTSEFQDIKFCRYFHHVISVENNEN